VANLALDFELFHALHFPIGFLVDLHTPHSSRGHPESTAGKLCCFSISATVAPLSKSAPVGQTCTHLPQLVQLWLRPPRLVEVDDHPAVDPAAHHIPHMRALDLVADAHAARAEDAAVVVQRVALVAGIHGQVGVEIVVAHMVHADLGGFPLQLAVAVHHADRAHVVAFGKEQFQDHLAIFDQPLAVGVDHHAFLHRRHTRRLQPSAALQLHHAQAAAAALAQPIQVAERRHIDPLLAQHGQQVSPSCALTISSLMVNVTTAIELSPSTISNL
jgi:hypothetical protein